MGIYPSLFDFSIIIILNGELGPGLYITSDNSEYYN
jgi:hypothetical protein